MDAQDVRLGRPPRREGVAVERVALDIENFLNHGFRLTPTSTDIQRMNSGASSRA